MKLTRGIPEGGYRSLPRAAIEGGRGLILVCVKLPRLWRLLFHLTITVPERP